MLDRVSAPGIATAIVQSGTSAAETTTNGTSAVDDGDWFRDAARVLLPHKAGTALHYCTGFDERICRRYAAGHVKPPAYFLRALLRSSQGRQWLCGVMEGADVPWWRDTIIGWKLADTAREAIGETR